MKTLLLLRHAKSDWQDTSLADFDRALNKRGQRTAPKMGAWITEQLLAPDVTVCSTALRARQTLELAITGGLAGGFVGGAEARVRHDERIYEASVGELLRVASEIEDDAASALLVGHNPGMEGTVQVLTGCAERMPTAALAHIELDIATWRAIEPGAGRLIGVHRPKELWGD